MKLWLYFAILILWPLTIFANQSTCSNLYRGKNYFVQTTVRGVMSAFKGEHKYISVRTSKNHWKTFSLVTLPPAFLKWNIGGRIKMLDRLRKGIYPAGGISEVHTAAVATYAKRATPTFGLNNAIKGLGYIPKRAYIDTIVAKLKATIKEPMPKKIEVLEKVYKHSVRYFDVSKMASLELYTNSQHCTNTFLNQMLNPIATIVFFALPNFMLKTVVVLLDPKDPNLTPFEKKIVTYVNLMHHYFHHNPRTYPVVIYNVVAVYNNTPDNRKDGRGKRVV